MSNCRGCFPFYQENQQAHIGRGGCMEMPEDCEYCLDNLEQIFATPMNDDDCAASTLTDISDKDGLGFDLVCNIGTCAVTKQPSGAIATDDAECCICYEIIGDKNNCVTPCGHKFCFKCVILALQYNNACPYCRTMLVDEVDDADNEEGDGDGADADVEDGDDDEDAEYDEIDDDYNDPVSGLAYVISHGAPIETVVERLEKAGITMIDAVSLLFSHYSLPRDDVYIEKLPHKFEAIYTDVQSEFREQQMFAQEDSRASAIATIENTGDDANDDKFDDTVAIRVIGRYFDGVEV